MRAIDLIVAALAVTVTIAVVKSGTPGQKQGGAVQTLVTPEQAHVATLNIPDMFCAGCEVGVKIAANKVDGVSEVKTHADNRTADVTFDPSKTNPQAIASAI